MSEPNEENLNEAVDAPDDTGGTTASDSELQAVDPPDNTGGTGGKQVLLKAE
jgi:hypothetical protein